MKKLVLLFSVVMVLSACSISKLTKVSSTSVGKLKVPQKDMYVVVYQANFGTRFTAEVSYTNADGKLIKLKDVVGEWKQTINLKAGTHVQMKTLAIGGKDDADYKITVNGETVFEKNLTGERIKCNYSFDLP